MADTVDERSETSLALARAARPGIPEASAAAKPWTGRGRGRRHIFARMVSGRAQILVDTTSSSYAASELNPLSLRLVQGEDTNPSHDDLLYLEPWAHVSPELVHDIWAELNI